MLEKASEGRHGIEVQRNASPVISAYFSPLFLSELFYTVTSVRLGCRGGLVRAAGLVRLFFFSLRLSFAFFFLACIGTSMIKTSASARRRSANSPPSPQD